METYKENVININDIEKRLLTIKEEFIIYSSFMHKSVKKTIKEEKRIIKEFNDYNWKIEMYVLGI